MNGSFNGPTSIVESAPAVIFCLDAELRLTYCNAAWDQFARDNGAPELCRPALIGRLVLDFIAEPDREYYARVYRRVLAQTQPREQLYECSSPQLYRQYLLRVLPLAKQAGLLVINSLQVEHAHGRVPCSPTEERYRNGQGLILMCSSCRRTRCDSPGEEIWEWVPHFVESMPPGVSYDICPSCREHYYLEAG